MDILELDARREVYRLIERQPGLHLRGIQSALGMAMGHLEYHLERLVRSGLVRVEQRAHKRFFPAALDRRDAPILAAMRAETPRRILVLVALQPMTRRRLGATLDVPRSTLNHHVGRLVTMDLIHDEGPPQASERRLAANDPGRVQAVYIRHRSGILDRWIDGFLAATDALRPPPSQK